MSGILSSIASQTNIRSSFDRFKKAIDRSQLKDKDPIDTSRDVDIFDLFKYETTATIADINKEWEEDINEERGTDINEEHEADRDMENVSKKNIDIPHVRNTESDVDIVTKVEQTVNKSMSRPLSKGEANAVKKPIYNNAPTMLTRVRTPRIQEEQKTIKELQNLRLDLSPLKGDMNLKNNADKKNSKYAATFKVLNRDVDGNTLTSSSCIRIGNIDFTTARITFKDGTVQDVLVADQLNMNTFAASLVNGAPMAGRNFVKSNNYLFTARDIGGQKIVANDIEQILAFINAFHFKVYGGKNRKKMYVICEEKFCQFFLKHFNLIRSKHAPIEQALTKSILADQIMSISTSLYTTEFLVSFLLREKLYNYMGHLKTSRIALKESAINKITLIFRTLEKLHIIMPDIVKYVSSSTDNRTVLESVYRYKKRVESIIQDSADQKINKAEDDLHADALLFIL